MRHRREVLTAGEAGWLLGVAPRTIGKWFGNGAFPNAYRIPNGSGRTHDSVNAGDRRIPINDVLTFAHRHKIRLPNEWAFDKRVILVESPDTFSPPTCPSFITIRVSFVGAARILPGSGVMPQLIVWTSSDSRLAAEVISLIPVWAPIPVLVTGDDGFHPEGLSDKVVVTQADNIDWNGIAERMASAEGLALHIPVLRDVGV